MDTQFLDVGNGAEARSIAFNHLPGEGPGLVWLGGYRSDMQGTKAMALENWAKTQGNACCRHDYSGHGESGGDFMEGTISRWLEESLAIFNACTRGPQILVGSSMGAWIALRMAQEIMMRKEAGRLHGMLLLAPAPDFTHELMAPSLSDVHKAQLQSLGFMEEPSQYSDEPDIFTRALFEDGEVNRVMNGPIDTGCPVHIIQGMKDEDVPYSHALKLMNFLPSVDVTLTLVKDGDHRLSREQDIALLLRSVEHLAANHA